MKDWKSRPEELWPGGPAYAGDSFSSDSLALADFACTDPVESVCDLGCGSGILLLLLSLRRPGMRLTGVDVRPAAIEFCRENLRRNLPEAEFTLLCRDLREAPVPAGSMDLVVSNPPYFRAGAGGVSPDSERARMRTESASVSELCLAAARILRPGGAFCLVHRPERLPEIFSALAGARLEPKRLRFFARDCFSPPAFFLCEAVRGASGGLSVLPAIYQCDADGETAEYRKICHWEA